MPFKRITTFSLAVFTIVSGITACVSNTDPSVEQAQASQDQGVQDQGAGQEPCANAPYSVPLYIRGSFNDWLSVTHPKYKLDLNCETSEYSVAIDIPPLKDGGQYAFKIADEGWGPETTFSVPKDADRELEVGGSKKLTLVKGPDILTEAGGPLLFTLDAKNPSEPTVKVAPTDHIPEHPIYDVDRLMNSYEFEKTVRNKEWNGVGDVSKIKRKGNVFWVYLDTGLKARIEVLGDKVVHLRHNESNKYKNDISYAVVDRKFEAPTISYKEKPDHYSIATAELDIEINKQPFRVNFKDKDGTVIHEDLGIYTHANEETTYVIKKAKSLEGVRYYGFGERSGLSTKKNGEAMRMWNKDAYGYNEHTDNLYSSIPFFIETNGKFFNGVFFDNSYQSYFNMEKIAEDEYFFGATGGEMDYYFIHGNDSKEVVKQYTKLTGRMQMPPKWALGFHQCRYSYMNEQEIYDLAKKFRDIKIPLDTIYLDIHYMDSFKSFTVDKENFPNLKKMIKDHQDQGFTFISIIDPHIKIEEGYHVYDSGLTDCPQAKDNSCFIKRPDGSFAQGKVWPGDSVFPDYFRDDVIEWWGELYRELAVDVGIDGFWNDMGEPATFGGTKTLPLDTLHTEPDQKTISSHAKIHNVYGFSQLQATLDGLDKLRPDNRNYVLARAAYAGMQRTGAIWTGDNSSNWTHLKMNIPMGLNLGLSGISMVGADVGGFVNAPTPELFARWMQLGAFFPIYRNHTALKSPPQEPWVFGKEVEDVSRKAVELRYELFPLVYDLTYQSHKTGLPLSRPMFMEHPEDSAVYDIDDQFLFGDALLVAAVVEEGATDRKVYFPKGNNWYTFRGNKKFDGGSVASIDVDIYSIPLFVKEGAIIPTQGVEQYYDELEINPITFEVYPGQVGNTYEYTLYRDAEVRKNYLKGEYQTLKITHQKTADNSQTLDFNFEHNQYTPPEKYMTFAFRDAQSLPKSVALAAGEISKAGSSSLPENENAYYYDAKSNVLYVRLLDTTLDKNTLKVTF